MREPDFEQSADMRLLELQRGALGLPARERHAWESRGLAEGSIPLEPEPDVEGRSAVLAVEAAAFPNDGVIPGAVVSLSLSVANEGAAMASDVLVAAPLPGGATYRPGTFVWNGRSTYDDVAEGFFGTGLPIGALAAGDRATFTWKISVRLGVKPLVIAPSVRAGNAAVVGARPVVIGRKAGSTAAFSSELARADASVYEPKPLIPVDIPADELPIYELDEEEQITYEATAAAIESAAVPDFVPAAPVVPATPQAVIEVAPEPLPEPEPVAQALPEPEPEPEPVPAPQPAQQTREGVLLYGRFDRTTVAFFERVLGGTKPPTVLQHCILGGALACSLDAGGAEVAGLKRHLDAQSQVLHRIVLHEKLGKKEPIAEYAGELLAELDRLRPAPIDPRAAAPQSGDVLALASELSEPTRVVLQKIGEERARWDFVKARQLTLALQAQTVADERLDATVRAQIEATLRGYAQASVTVLQKLFVRIRIDRTTGILFQTDATLDDAANAVIAALKRALP